VPSPAGVGHRSPTTTPATQNSGTTQNGDGAAAVPGSFDRSYMMAPRKIGPAIPTVTRPGISSVVDELICNPEKSSVGEQERRLEREFASGASGYPSKSSAPAGRYTYSHLSLHPPRANDHPDLPRSARSRR
jgi:hypothetical protein